MTGGLERKFSIQRYLRKLSHLTTRIVGETDLADIAVTAEIQAVGKKSAGAPKTMRPVELQFLHSNSFADFTRKIGEFSDVASVWLEETVMCGAYFVKTTEIGQLNFSKFAEIEDVIVFLSSDRTERIMLNFISDGTKVPLEITVQGDAFLDAAAITMNEAGF